MATSSELLAGITGQIQDLVRIPSQAFVDSLDGMLAALAAWMKASGLSWQPLRDGAGRPVAILATLDSGRPGPIVCLDACIDTAPAGRRDAWRLDPFSGTIEGDKLHGRGAADSKAGVAIFCHLARELALAGGPARGTLHVLLDGDEHTGSFGGARAFAKQAGSRVSFAAIGYPGNEKVVVGARGFFRAALRVFGDEVHSGAADQGRTRSAILKMARLVQILSRSPLPVEPDPDFSHGPSLNVTQVQGGTGFSQIPGVCEANVDVRLTPGFDAAAARQIVREALEKTDAELPSGEASVLEERESWPPYKLDRDLPAVEILRQCAEENLGRSVRLGVSRFSNIGNYFATCGIPAACGLGVAYENIHSPNECIDLGSILPVYITYRMAVDRWLEELPA